MLQLQFIFIFISGYLYVYRLSYQWYIVISFLTTVIIGVLFSWIGSKFGGVTRTFHPDLFIPPVANYLKKKRRKLEVRV